MDLTYAEIKEDIEDSFESLHQNFHYPVQDAFYATLDDYKHHASSTQTEECCIYIYAALILLQHKENIDFMKERLFELISKNYYSVYEIELKEEYINLKNDIETLKTILE